jgi:hypothetical protein
MRLDRFDLTYCSNIHAGEQWADVRDALAMALPSIRAGLDHRGPFAIGLRLSAAAARTLENPDELRRFRDFLRDGNYYVPTINGFPYGAFHGTRVKERVYQPDWRTSERVDYSNRLARLLVALHDGHTTRLSISTVPGAFRTEVTSQADIDAIAANILAHAAYLKRLDNETGVTVTLAIEPEPACIVETVDEAISLFRSALFSTAHIARASAQAGFALTKEDVARHVGICLDACHMAVEFDDSDRAIGALEAEGISIAKVQLSSALRLCRAADAPSPSEVLSRFADDTYLHQVVIADEHGRLTRFTDLPDALAACGQNSPKGNEWRVHFHVPIFLASMSGFDTTQPYLETMLQQLQQKAVSTCLEVETYTWDVLPPEYRTTDVRTAIARELAWVRDRLSH